MLRNITTRLLLFGTLLCFSSLFVVAQDVNKLIEAQQERLKTAQERLDKVSQQRREADSLDVVGRRLVKEGLAEQDNILRDQETLDKRVDAALS
ncbi:MAG: hypothetical protein LBH34_03450, partial [Prevotellaceae bacterium]|nr:hypothetical protein [Prevotellaceae bacterium]